MNPARSLIALLPAPDSGLWMVLVAIVGAAAGRLLTKSVGGLLDAGAFAYEESPVKSGENSTGSRRWIEMAVAAAFAAARGAAGGDSGGGRSVAGDWDRWPSPAPGLTQRSFFAVPRMPCSACCWLPRLGSTFGTG